MAFCKFDVWYLLDMPSFCINHTLNQLGGFLFIFSYRFLGFGFFFTSSDAFGEEAHQGTPVGHFCSCCRVPPSECLCGSLSDGMIRLLRFFKIERRCHILILGSRESNKVAHLLASRAEGPLSNTWYVDLPTFILDVIANDVNLFEVQ